MKALLKNSNEWITIDTTALFNNQYNTADGKRIFDRDILAIKDDARKDMGKCKYCGALVKRGEEEKHFLERENRGCNGCFWLRDKVIERNTTVDKNTTTENSGERKTVKTVTTIEKMQRVCTFSECSSCKSNCTLTECRAYGIEWFTPENTFFLKFPNGFNDITDIDKLKARGFDFIDGRYYADYFEKIGSYSLHAKIEYKDGKPIVAAYRIYNCRRDYTFRFENGELFTNKYSFGFRKCKTLDGVPASVMESIKKICNN